MSNSTLYHSSMIEESQPMLLKYLADKIYTGATPSGSLEYSEYGVSKLVRGRDISQEVLTISPTQLASTNWEGNPWSQYLIKDSIVILARGWKVIANVFTGDEYDKTIASNTFIIINLLEESKKILRPEFIAWYVNHADDAKKHIETNATGTSLLMTNIQTFKELPILIPPLAIQDKILTEFKQVQQDVEVMQRMIELRQEFSHAYSEQLLYKAFNDYADLKQTANG